MPTILNYEKWKLLKEQAQTQPKPAAKTTSTQSAQPKAPVGEKTYSQVNY